MCPQSRVTTPIAILKEQACQLFDFGTAPEKNVVPGAYALPFVVYYPIIGRVPGIRTDGSPTPRNGLDSWQCSFSSEEWKYPLPPLC